MDHRSCAEAGTSCEKKNRKEVQRSQDKYILLLTFLRLFFAFFFFLLPAFVFRSPRPVNIPWKYTENLFTANKLENSKHSYIIYVVELNHEFRSEQPVPRVRLAFTAMKLANHQIFTVLLSVEVPLPLVKRRKCQIFGNPFKPSKLTGVQGKELSQFFNLSQ